MSNSKLKSALTPVRNGSCAAGFADDGKWIVPNDFGTGDCADSETERATANDTQASLISTPRPRILTGIESPYRGDRLRTGLRHRIRLRLRLRLRQCRSRSAPPRPAAPPPSA